MRSLQQFLDDYGDSHRHPVNQWVHIVCVPAIFFSTLGLLWLVPIGRWLGLDGAFELEVEGECRQTRAAVVAPDVAQALDPRQTTMLVVQLDPDSDAWRRLKGNLAGRPSMDLPLGEDMVQALARSDDCRPLSALAVTQA